MFIDGGEVYSLPQNYIPYSIYNGNSIQFTLLFHRILSYFGFTSVSAIWIIIFEPWPLDPWVRRYIYLQLILNSFTQLNDITVLFSPAQFVYIIALKQTRNIPDRSKNLYAADRAI